MIDLDFIIESEFIEEIEADIVLDESSMADEFIDEFLMNDDSKNKKVNIFESTVYKEG